MGMFQPQNYGADFVNSMAATSGMLNDRRKLDMAEKKDAEETQIRAQEAKTRDLQQQGLQLDNQKKAQDVARETALADFLDRRKRMEAGTLTPDDYPALAGDTQKVMEFTPYLPADPAEIPKYKQSLSTLIQGVDSIRSLPPSNYHYTRADNIPEVNATLDAYQTMLSKDRLGKEFTDTDGSVTGKAGNTYRTTGVGGFVMASGNGREAAFTPLFSIADAQGNPVIGADGKPVMVPATVNGSNSPNDQIRQVTPEEMLTKAGFAYKVLDTADKLGLSDPAKQKEYFAQNLPYYMGEKGAEMMLKNSEKDKTLHAFGTDQNVYDGNGKQIQAAERKDKYMTVAEGGKVIDTATGAVIAEGTPKEAKAPATVKAGAGGGMLQELAFNAKTGNYDIPVGKPFPAHPAKEGDGKKGTVHVGNLNAATASVVRQFIPVAQWELKRQGKTLADIPATDADKEMNLHVSQSGIYSNLSPTGQQVFNRALKTSQDLVGQGVVPERAASEAIEEARKYYNLDEKGMVKTSPPPSPAPQRASAPEPKPQPKPKKDNGPTLSSARPIKSQPGKHLITLSDGTTWIGSKGAKGWSLEVKAQIK